MTIQDLLMWCLNKEKPYPLTARLVLDIEDGDGFDLEIAGCHGHGHDEEEILILVRAPEEEKSPPQSTTRKACCGNCAERLTLTGCDKYSETNDDGCCIDHKFL